ncbi:phosphoglycolate phosphatase [Pacificibacter maritimus]|uniref:phosphoglycolate phosphatase n=1 Tax=Pacificibacter maritimus TaxID=762213 RepID=A0A3N4UKF5_9RHOB|nr:HAD-IA family hydrolase [Pacificibacter maritimus]RPE71082.1 phosphoglycolate phosphatase [Pacificibacter maritimus]
MRCVIFDLDGTLADTSADLIASANYCFNALGYGDVLDPIKDASTAFHGGRAMLNLGFGRVKPDFDQTDIDTQYPVLLQAYGDAINVHTKLYDGAVEAIEGLKSAGYAVGVCTNKPSGLAENLLQKLGVRDLFASMIGADTLPVRKPDPAPYEAAVEQAGGTLAMSYLVGDTITDRKTAAAAGVPCALVTFGPDGEAVRALKPEALLSSYADLARVTKELIG